MSTQGIRLDPEVEGLLREIAADPDSGLLRVERPTTLRPLLEREHAAGARMAGLTNAERHLLERYRDEVGSALLWGALILLREDEAVRDHLLIYDDQGHPQKKPDRTSWQTKVAELGRGPHIRGSVPEPRGIELLLSANSGYGPSHPGVVELSLASLRIRPTPHATIYCAEYWGSHGQVSTASLALRGLLQRGTDSRSTAWAWTNLGKISHRRGDAVRALAAYERAAAEYPRDPAALLCSMIQSMVLGNARKSRLYVRKHDDLVMQTGESAEDSIRVIETEIAANRLHRIDGRKLLGTDYESLGEESRRIIHAMS